MEACAVLQKQLKVGRHCVLDLVLVDVLSRFAFLIGGRFDGGVSYDCEITSVLGRFFTGNGNPTETRAPNGKKRTGTVFVVLAR